MHFNIELSQETVQLLLTIFIAWKGGTLKSLRG
jgi:hypothetical protein